MTATTLIMATEQRRRQNEKLKRELGPVVLGALNDPKIVEILLNADGKLWIDVLGEGLKETGYSMLPEQAENLLGTVAVLLGTVVNRDQPLLEGELLLDGSRFQGVLAPIAPSPLFAIRKRAIQVFTLHDYLKQGAMTEAQAQILRAAVIRKRNLLIIGGTSSGKTTLANALLHVITEEAPQERLVILEDTVELQCTAPNHVALRTSDTVTLTRLLRATLRLRPDRIVVGEVRGGEALALLKAWNTGHSGGLSTLHANNAAAGLTRLEQFIQEAGVPPQRALVAEAVHLIVALAHEGGRRLVKELLEVRGLMPDGHYDLTPV